MKLIELKYKQETGFLPNLKKVEPIEMIEKIDMEVLNGFDKEDLITFIKWQKTWMCFDIYEIPEEYVKHEELRLPNPDYIKWLEEKLEKHISLIP